MELQSMKDFLNSPEPNQLGLINYIEQVGAEMAATEMWDKHCFSILGLTEPVKHNNGTIAWLTTIEIGDKLIEWIVKGNQTAHGVVIEGWAVKTNFMLSGLDKRIDPYYIRHNFILHATTFLNRLLHGS